MWLSKRAKGVGQGRERTRSGDEAGRRGKPERAGKRGVRQ